MGLIEQGVDRVRRETWDSEVRDDAERELVVSVEPSVSGSPHTAVRHTLEFSSRPHSGHVCLATHGLNHVPVPATDSVPLMSILYGSQAPGEEGAMLMSTALVI